MYTVEVSKRAGRDLKKLARDVQVRVAAAIEALARDPRPSGVKKLTDTPGLYRIRVGDYRIIYTIEDERLVILVLGIGSREDIYVRFG